MYLPTIGQSWGLFQFLGIITRLLVVLRPYFFIPLDRDVMTPVTVINFINKKYLNPSGFNHIYNTRYYQRGFVSSDLQEPLSSDPKDSHLLEYESSMILPL